MSTNTPGSVQAPYLPTSISLPKDPNDLPDALTKRHIEIAQVVNRRTIGIFNKIQVVTGDQYYSLQTNDIHVPVQFRQGYRQLFTFGAVAAGATTTITHGITGITEIVHLYGNCITDAGTIANAKYEPLPFVSTTLNQQVSIYMNDTIITIINGAGNNNILSGTIIVEYLLN